MGIRTRRAHQHSKTNILAFAFVGMFGFLALLGVTVAMSVSSLAESWLEDLPDYSSADAYLVAEPTEVYDARGNLIAEFYLQNRRSITMDEVSPYVLIGTVDTEDIRYYQHQGVDLQGIARAVYVQLLGGSEGASTITQQLVRNTVLSAEQFDKTLRRKVREAYVATEMEKTYTKDQILMMYLNTIYYGHGAYGIEAASRTFFNKTAAELTLPEAALLVGLPQSPSANDPLTNPENALARRNLVLNRMFTAGDITQAEYDEARQTDLGLNPGSSVMAQNGKYPYWTYYIKGLLEEDFEQDTILQGGLKIYTTIDPDCQRAAQEAVEEQLVEFGDDELEGAMVVIDVHTGNITAMVGGRDFNRDQFNLATQARRQPGSSFKVFTLTAALDQGMNPSVILNCNSPIQATPTWKVQNIDNYSYGNISLARATELSANTGFVQVTQAIGSESLVSMAHAMGIDVDLPAYDSLTLGTIGVPPVQMAEAYATLASGGVHHDAIAITRILDRNGNVVYEHEDNSTQAVSPEVAAAVTQVLEGVPKNGTATVLWNYTSVDQPIAGKTGTTDDTRDLWFVGYTPDVSIAIWTGYRQERRITHWGGVEAHPYDTSVPIFGRYLQKMFADAPRAEFPVASMPHYKSNTSWVFSETPDWANNPALAPQEEGTSVEEIERKRQEEEEAARKAEEEEAARQAAEEEARRAAEEEAARRAAEEEAARQAAEEAAQQEGGGGEGGEG